MKVIEAYPDAIENGVLKAIQIEDDDISKLFGEDTVITLETCDCITDLAMFNGAFYNNGEGLLLNLEINGSQSFFPVAGLSSSIGDVLGR